MTETLELLSGATNGINVTFTSSGIVNSSPVLYINGLIYSSQDTVFGYSVSGTIWTLTTAPIAGDVVVGYYIT